MKKIFLLLVFLLIAGCSKGDGEMVSKFKKDDNFLKSLETLSTRTVYFGHQSVGYNIMDGVLDIHEDKLNIVDLKRDEYKGHNGEAFIHGKIGKNFHPITKIESFEKNIASITPNIAVIKFCFVDIDRDTDVKKLTDAYSSMSSRLKDKYPEVAFVHTTVPLTPVGGIKGHLKAIIKVILGKEDSNIKRMRYNSFIRDSYKNSNVFDIAKLESSYESGKTKSGNKKGESFEIMLDEYNLDCGHLNNIGRRYIAGEFIKFLAKIEIADNGESSETSEEKKDGNS